MKKNIVLATLALASLVMLAGCGSAEKAVQTGMSGLSQELLSSFGSVGSILGSITESESAKAAVPQLDAVGVDLDALAKQAANASPEVQSSMSDVVTSQIPGLQQAIDTAYAIPGVEPVVKPSIDSLLTKFMSFQ